jgi:hypothetical protein
VSAAIADVVASGNGAPRGEADAGIVSLIIAWDVDTGASAAGSAIARSAVTVVAAPDAVAAASQQQQRYFVPAPGTALSVDVLVSLCAPSVRVNVSVLLENCYGSSSAAETRVELLVLRFVENDDGGEQEARSNCTPTESTTSVRRAPALAAASSLPLIRGGSVCAAHGVAYAPAPDVYGVDVFVHVVGSAGGGPSSGSASRDVGVVALIKFRNQPPRLASAALAVAVADGDVPLAVDIGGVASDVEGDALLLTDVRWTAPEGGAAAAAATAAGASAAASSSFAVSGLIITVRVGGRDGPAAAPGAPAAVRHFRSLAFTVSDGTSSVRGNVSFDVSCSGAAATLGSVPNVWSRGPLCLACPPGAKCADDGAVPFALPGWFEHTDGDGGLVYAPCSPPEKCCGANTCCEHLGYTDVDRLCGVCARRYYKLGTMCKPCPPNSGAASVALFAVVGVVACVAVCWVMARGVDTAFVQIGINFSQTIAIISSFRVAWPGAVAGAMSSLSFANLNLDLAKPECSIEGFGWSERWVLYMLTPPVVVAATLVAVFLVVPCLSRVRRMCSGGRSAAAAAAAAAAPPRRTLAPAGRRASAAATMKDIMHGALTRSQFDLAKLVMFMALKILYVMLCTQALSFFDCTRVGEVSPVYVFDADPSLK